ncbi:MAG: hypothetical protein K2O44_01520 [Clostridia bacterium]|nr:hypothetical protein [Clostridia bacterium]
MLYILTPLFCAGLCLGTVFSFLKTDRSIAEAATAATVNEITINSSGTATNGFVFRQDNLNTLYNKILNRNSGATLDDVASSINGTATYAGKGTGSIAVNKIRNSSEINGGALLKVRFGGLEWQVTSVTKNSAGNVIASLWLTDNNSTVDTYVNGLTKKGQFSYGAATTSNVTYPSSVYGTSFIRVVALNAGGQYSTSTTKATTYGQDSSNVFAKFTMTGAAGSLTKYIAKPSTVKYQEVQSFADANTGTTAIFACPNEAYGNPCNNTWYSNDIQINFTLATDSSKWKDDYIWLPSYTEIGGAYSTTIATEGLWKTTSDGRKRTGTGGAWLRTANNNSKTNVYGQILYVDDVGGLKVEASNSVKTVRPALHLNLTEAQKVAAATINKPSQAQDLRYNGEAQTYTPTGFDPNTMEISGNVVTELGEYTCTVTPKSGYAWSDYSKDGEKIPFKVKKTPSNFTFGYVDSDIDLKKLYLKDYPTLPEITNVHDNPTDGELTWDEGQSPSKETSIYYWTFKPTNSDFYEEVSGYETLNFREAAITGLVVTKDEDKDIYDRYDSITYSSLEDYLKRECLTVKILYEDNTTSASPLGMSDYTITTKSILVTEGDSQEKTISLRATSSTNAQLNGMTGSITTEVKKAIIESIEAYEAPGAEPLVYPLTIDDVKNSHEVYIKWNFSARALKAPADRITIEQEGGGTELTADTLSFLFTYTDGELTATTDPVEIEISKGTHDVSGITFTGGSPITYNGQGHSIAYSGTLPAGVSVQYTYEGTTQSTPFEFTEADDYEITLSFTQDDTDNYEVITKTITATLKIIDAVMTDITVDFEQGDTVVYPSTDLDTLKDLITVTALYNNGTSQEITDYALSGEFTVGERQFTVTYGGFTKTITVTVTAIALDRIEAEFTQDGAVYPSTGLDTLKDWLTVTAYYNDESEEVVSDYELSGTLTAGESKITVTYGGKDYVITVDVTAIELVRIEVEFEQDGEVYPTSALSVLKPWLTVTAYYNDESEEVVTDYELSGAFTAGESQITVAYGGLEKTISVEVTDVAIVSVEFSFTQDGVVYPSSSLDLLKGWLTVTATLNNGATDEIESYELSGEFTVGESEITVSYGEYSQTITVNVTAVAVDYIEAEFAQGGVVYYNTELSVLKDWLTVTAHYTDGTSQVITDYELSGVFTTGASEITVTYGAEHTDTVTVTVDKVKVALPVYKNTLSYSGDEIKPTAADFNGFDGAIMAFVESKTVAGVNAGAYKAVFALTDTEHYDWATVTTHKKAVFAVVVYDEIALDDNEAAVEWNIARAKISATRANGKLPVFTSESFKGSFADIITLKYYTDETCEEEISADELAYSTKYYVKAELLDNANFELDETAKAFSESAFEYTTPEKQLTIWEKIIKFVTVNWMWIAIAAAVLLILIIVIACAARSAKKKREREEQRRLEEKEERRREKEEREERRREEREERMARMSQQQMMMPQMMPQAGGQAMAMGGASSNELAELKAEMAAMRTEAALRAEMAAKDTAEIKAQHAAEQQVVNLLARLGGEQVISNGITLDKLTEIVEKTVERVLERKEKSVAAPTSDGAATTQVPPDAVMTTVTTTKIDTTKKPVQNAQNAAAPSAPAGRNIVRNFVAPMPVDDGRVFDVGGFYNPAEPITDDIENLLDDDKD